MTVCPDCGAPWHDQSFVPCEQASPMRPRRMRLVVDLAMCCTVTACFWVAVFSGKWFEAAVYAVLTFAFGYQYVEDHRRHHLSSEKVSS